MAKKYAPPAPDSRWHRPGDTAYLRELLEAAGLSQRKAGPLLGMDERAMRYKVSGESNVSYPEQYCLEVLADQRGDSGMSAANEPRPDAKVTNKDVERALEKMDNEDLAHSIALSRGKDYVDGAPSRTVWHIASERPLGNDDAGKIVVGEDKGGATVIGKMVRDGFGLVIQDLNAYALDRHSVPVDRVAVYTLLDARA